MTVENVWVWVKNR